MTLHRSEGTFTKPALVAYTGGAASLFFVGFEQWSFLDGDATF